MAQTALSPEDQDVLEFGVGISSPEVKSTGVLPLGYGNFVEPAAQHIQTPAGERKARLGTAKEYTPNTGIARKSENNKSKAV